jgi:hypothetical protein
VTVVRALKQFLVPEPELLSLSFRLLESEFQVTKVVESVSL